MFPDSCGAISFRSVACRGYYSGNHCGAYLEERKMYLRAVWLLDIFAILVLGLSLAVQSTGAEGNAERIRRELPNSLSCDVRSTSDATRCYKGDLIDTDVADCKYKRSSLLSGLYCLPVKTINWYKSSSVVDVEKDGDCKAVTGKLVTCGERDTRCVCDKAVDFTSEHARSPWPNCRCQYWPAEDVREARESVCHQYDHGGVSKVHFYACCNNCKDADRSCTGDSYQGGGTTDSLCGTCGEPNDQQKGIGVRKTYVFNCQSCQRQRQCNEQCNSQHPIAKRAPGLCPLWLGCFRRCCISTNPTYRGKRDADESQTCNGTGVDNLTGSLEFVRPTTQASSATTLRQASVWWATIAPFLFSFFML